MLRGELNSFFGFIEGNLVNVRIANLFESSDVDEARMSGFAVRGGSGLRTCTSPNDVLEMRRGNPSSPVLAAFGRPSLARTRPG